MDPGSPLEVDQTDALPAWERFRLFKDPSFRFDPIPHLSYLQDKILWSITGSLKQSGIVKTDYYTREGMIRGSYVHSACHYLDESDLDWSALENHPYNIIGYVRAWEAFKRDWNFKPRLIELPMYEPNLMMSGIPDREGLILDGEPAIVEIKSGSMKFWTAFQTAGQDLLLQAWDAKPVYRRRFGVALQADGTYKKPVEFTDDHDYDVMRWAVGVSQAAGGVDRGVPPIEELT
jgi:hypothetical protein